MDPENTQTAQPVQPIPVVPPAVPVETVPVQPIQPTPVQTVPPIPTKSGSKLKLILGIIILILVSAGILLAKSGSLSQLTAKPTPTPVPTQIPIPTPTTDPTANWKTYNNTKFNYSFKYPVEWGDCPNDFGGGQTDTAIYLCSASLQPFDYIWTSFMDNPQNLNFQQLATQNLSSDLKNNFKYTAVTIGLNSANVTKSLPAANESEEVFFKMPNNGYIGISYQPNNSKSGFTESSSSYKIFYQILSTFHFD